MSAAADAANSSDAATKLPAARAKPIMCLLPGADAVRHFCDECADASPLVSTTTSGTTAARLFAEMLGGDAAAIHLVFEAAHRRAAQVPRQPGASGAAAGNLVGKERIEIVHGVDLARRGIAPTPTEQPHPPPPLAHPPP